MRDENSHALIVRLVHEAPVAVRVRQRVAAVRISEKVANVVKDTGSTTDKAAAVFWRA